MQLVSYFPVSVFGGLGITETSALYFWSFFDISQDVLAPALIGIRVVFYLFNVISIDILARIFNVPKTKRTSTQ